MGRRNTRHNDDSFLLEPTPLDKAIVHVSFELESDSDDDDDDDDSDSESTDYSGSESDYSNSSTSSGSSSSNSSTNAGSSSSSSNSIYSGTGTRGVYTKANQVMMDESGSEDGSSEGDTDCDSNKNHNDNDNNNNMVRIGYNDKGKHDTVEQDLNETSSTLDSFLLRICGGGAADVSSAIEEDNRKMEDGYVFERQDYPYTQTDSESDSYKRAIQLFDNNDIIIEGGEDCRVTLVAVKYK